MHRDWNRPGVILVAAALSVLPGCDEKITPPPADRVEIEVAVAPRSATVVVGQSLQLVALVTGPAAMRGLTYSSTNISVATVSRDGLVSCVGEGISVISAIADVDASARDASTVICTAAVPPPPQPPTGVLIEIGGGNIAFTHTRGGSPCPQEAGAFRVRNTTGVPMNVQVSPRHRAIEVRPSQFVIPPGETCPFAVFFNCAVQSSFQTAIDVVGRGASGEDTEVVRVEATIR